MNTAFTERARAAIGNHQLHVALDRTTAQLGLRRSTALESLERSDDVRNLARHAKMELLRHLGDSLQQFERRLIDNGAHVHWAGTGDDANRIIVDIATRTGVRRVAKAKSMASEETHLNLALERAGLQVIETDLGEYIVQLAHDRPSHIIAPIIHMTR